MTKLNEVYKCSVCGNIVQVVHASSGTLVCCGKPMNLQKENTVDASLEKHVPVVEKINGGIKVSVGSVLHPMEEKHYIEWIQAQSGDLIIKKFLKPGDSPEAEFEIEGEEIEVRAYCNLHGLWQAKV